MDSQIYKVSYWPYFSWTGSLRLCGFICPKGTYVLDPRGSTAGLPLTKLVRRQLSQLHGMICDEEAHRDSAQVYTSSWSGKMRPGNGRGRLPFSGTDQSLTPTLDYLKVLV